MPTEKASTSTGQASKTKTPKKKESKDLASKVDKKFSNKSPEKKISCLIRPVVTFGELW